jgi:hypothetical protein
MRFPAWVSASAQQLMRQPLFRQRSKIEPRRTTRDANDKMATMTESLGQVIPPHAPPQELPEVLWHNCVTILRTKVNNEVSYQVKFDYPGNGGNAQINELIHERLNELAKQLPT